ncbi:carboxymuconolactone decarboxylase family protein [Spirillospora sp. CA-255316]
MTGAEPGPSARLPLVSPDTAEAAVRVAMGRLPDGNVFRAMANATEVFPPMIEVMRALFKDLAIDLRLARSAVLVVARLLECTYVWRQNVITARSVGVTTAQIEAIEAGELRDGAFSAVQCAVLRFTEEFVRDVEVSDDTYQAVDSALGPRQTAELMLLIGTYSTLCRFVRSGRVPLDAIPGPSPYGNSAVWEQDGSIEAG